MIINSSELRAAGFKMTEVIPTELEQAARRGGTGRRNGAGVRRIRGHIQRFKGVAASTRLFEEWQPQPDVDASIPYEPTKRNRPFWTLTPLPQL